MKTHLSTKKSFTLFELKHFLSKEITVCRPNNLKQIIFLSFHLAQQSHIFTERVLYLPPINTWPLYQIFPEWDTVCLSEFIQSRKSTLLSIFQNYSCFCIPRMTALSSLRFTSLHLKSLGLSSFSETQAGVGISLLGTAFLYRCWASSHRLLFLPAWMSSRELGQASDDPRPAFWFALKFTLTYKFKHWKIN